MPKMILRAKFTDYIKDLLEKYGFRNVRIEVTKLPQRYAAVLDNRDGASMISYMKISTHVGIFGIVPGDEGLVMDLTDLGLKCRDLMPDGLAEGDGDGFLIALSDDDSLVAFRQMLEAAKKGAN